MIDFSSYTPRIRKELGNDLTYTEVSQVLDLFLGIIIGDLSDTGRATVPGLGVFRAKYWSDKKLSVKFTPHPITRRALSESLGGRYQMDKYNVAQDSSADKTAAKTGTCPECGRQLDTDSAVPKCPQCGTKPFETREEPTNGGQDKEGGTKEKTS